MKKSSLFILASLIMSASFGQDMKKFNLYKPEENAEQKIIEAVNQAKAEGKHVFIQIGGNWCIWCARFNEFVTNDRGIDSIIKSSYVVYHLNYSEQNSNEKLLARYGYPQRMGYPVFLVLDRDGKLLHTQNSGYLEDGKKSYNRSFVMSFLSEWSPLALDPKSYKEK